VVAVEVIKINQFVEGIPQRRCRVVRGLLNADARMGAKQAILVGRKTMSARRARCR